MFDNYINYIQNIINNNDITNFKRNNIYNSILEHVNYQQGADYLKLILDEFNIDIEKIIEFSNMNDKIGNPVICDYGKLKCSPSSLRYIYHGCLIFNHINKVGLNNLNIVELGGGYGGLCLCINYFAKYFNITINKYHIIDLPVVNKLINKYLENFNLNFNIEIHDSNSYGSNINDTNLFMISNYCYSEIDISHRNKYKEILIPKIINGFIIWNVPILETIKKEQTCENERPLTGQYNKFIYL
jgi:hypothetical protein